MNRLVPTSIIMNDHYKLNRYKQGMFLNVCTLQKKNRQLPLTTTLLKYHIRILDMYWISIIGCSDSAFVL